MPGNHAEPLRHLRPHPNTLTPKHNRVPIHTITTDRNQARSFTLVKNLPQGVDKGMRWRSTTALRECRAFGEPCRCPG